MSNLNHGGNYGGFGQQQPYHYGLANLHDNQPAKSLTPAANNDNLTNLKKKQYPKKAKHDVKKVEKKPADKKVNLMQLNRPVH